MIASKLSISDLVLFSRCVVQQQVHSFKVSTAWTDSPDRAEQNLYDEYPVKMDGTMWIKRLKVAKALFTVETVAEKGEYLARRGSMYSDDYTRFKAHSYTNYTKVSKD